MKRNLIIEIFGN